MRVVDLVDELDAVAGTHTHGGRGPLPDAVEREDGGLVERRRIEGGRRMRAVVLREEEPPVLPERAQRLANEGFDPHLRLQERRGGVHEHRAALGSHRQRGLHGAVQRANRVVIEDHGIQVGGFNQRLAEAVVDGVRREAGVVLPAGETLFLRGRDDLVVARDGRRGVVVEGREAKGRDRRLRHAWV